VTGTYTTANGTALAGNDYTGASGTFTIAAGNTSTTVVINTTDDALDENDGETFTMSLSALTNSTAGTLTGTGTINDNDNPPTVNVDSPVAVTEGTNITFTISLNTASGKPVTGTYTTIAGTATAGSDYTTTTGTFTIAAGSTTTTVNVTTINDTIDENNGETLSLTLSNLTNGTAGTMTGTGLINDNDAQPTVSVNSPAAVTEGTNITFTISINTGSGLPVTGTYTTTNGTATAGSDYTTTA
jgi:chitinase